MNRLSDSIQRLSLALVAATAILAPLEGASQPASAQQKPRVVVTTDPELDDFNSLIRYLLYLPDFRTEGIVYNASGVHWKGDGRGTAIDPPDGDWRRFGLALCPCTSWRWASGRSNSLRDMVYSREAWRQNSAAPMAPQEMP